MVKEDKDEKKASGKWDKWGFALGMSFVIALGISLFSILILYAANKMYKGRRRLSNTKILNTPLQKPQTENSIMKKANTENIIINESYIPKAKPISAYKLERSNQGDITITGKPFGVLIQTSAEDAAKIYQARKQGQ